MNLDNMPSVAYHYDVTLTPDRPKKYIRPAFEKFNKEYFKDIVMAFDGTKSFYTVQKLPCSSCDKEVELDDTGSRKINFKISVKETSDLEVDLSSLRSYYNNRLYDKPMRALQCLEVVLSTPCHNLGKRAGRSFYTKPSTFYDLKDGYEMWTGIYQALILGDQPFLNVDISHKSFPTESTLLNYMAKNLQNYSMGSTLRIYDKNQVENFLKGVNIVYTPPQCFNSFPKTYKVTAITDKAARNIYFKLEDGKECSVANYFASKGAALRYPDLNCIIVGTHKTNYIPIEFCSIPGGQAINKKDGSRQVQQMIRYAATSTHERKIKILNMLQYFNHNINATIKSFGIKIEGQFIDVPIELLKSPSLGYSNEIIVPRNGSWRLQDSTKFLDTKPAVSSWVIIYKGPYLKYNDVFGFGKKLAEGARKRNMALAPEPEIFDFNNIDNIMSDLKKKGFRLVVVILPFKGLTYADIKQTAELKYGILTQCIKEKTLQRVDNQLILNLLLKINVKLNGTNHEVKDLFCAKLQKVMYLGADVTHPSPDQRDTPSVVGVAASHDRLGACYNMQYRFQKSTLENIEDMDSILLHHLNIYHRNQKHYPEHIIYYRDGVSDGQFPIVKNNELKSIRSACSKLKIDVKLTCVIVVKRHHTRFFPKEISKFDKYNNVSPGTVVDKKIVHPNEIQFFMVSHQSIQGTAKPTRYNVIEDDAALDMGVLKNMTYKLCHLFPRCNRSVSYPTPAYLAHLAAYRGRVYLEGTGKIVNPKEMYKKRQVKEEFLINNPMYFV